VGEERTQEIRDKCWGTEGKRLPPPPKRAVGDQEKPESREVGQFYGANKGGGQVMTKNPKIPDKGGKGQIVSSGASCRQVKSRSQARKPRHSDQRKSGRFEDKRTFMAAGKNEFLMSTLTSQGDEISRSLVDSGGKPGLIPLSGKDPDGNLKKRSRG